MRRWAGMAATRASGTNSLRYGSMREAVVSLKAVLADGTVVNTASRARKSSAGYDLTRLLIGSEGTLAVISEVTVRLHPLPESRSVAVCAFPTIGAAVNAAIPVSQLGLAARMELLDEAMVSACNRFCKLTLPELPHLFLEFSGSAVAIDEQRKLALALVAEQGATATSISTTNAEIDELWSARHKAYYAALATRPGSRGLTTDVCVPLSHLAECLLETKRDVAASGLHAPVVAHIGEGAFHLIFPVDPEDGATMAAIAGINERMVRRAQQFGGTCTGEHGVGLGKKKYLEGEVEAAGVAMMGAIKRALDPQGILNPGKVI
eukprot:TRINITY_DN2072_c1_g1_i1.p1 TRINITY_DN2072_c1_g1~~TRINITY_DN2072_c1_g1_i1.p1  ORF type:complete len:321 (-),score=57.11 TRINITY_DN2072_c1_g1_i1:12-974(-)